MTLAAVIVRLQSRSASVCWNHLETTFIAAPLSHFLILSVFNIAGMCRELGHNHFRPRLVSAIFTAELVRRGSIRVIRL